MRTGGRGQAGRVKR
uniref:Uncharacterized protein n=1 Tax=Anguilla anguilla TaxID=7936 RepID=A0A0E9U9B3_ANGAN